MGCSISKSCTQIGRNPKAATSSSSSSTDPALCSVSSPAVLSLPSHLVHHPPLKKGDTYHVVSLTSSTYGSLLLIDPKNPDFTSQVVSATDYHKKLSTASHPARKGKENITEEGSKDDSLSPDSVINAWELMDGLEDPDSDPNKSSRLRSSVEEDGDAIKPALSIHKDDSDVLHCFEPSKKYVCLSNGSDDDQVILYFTSLRGIRKTFEDCCFVRMTLRGFQVPVDERDISMDSSYKKELQSLLEGKSLTLPQVFIRGNHVGGVEKIKQLNEAGELGKLLEGFPVQDYKFVCINCGDARFVPCPSCRGSRKVFDEKEDRLRRCLDCNENGLRRCPSCCCS